MIAEKGSDMIKADWGFSGESHLGLPASAVTSVLFYPLMWQFPPSGLYFFSSPKQFIKKPISGHKSYRGLKTGRRKRENRRLGKGGEGQPMGRKRRSALVDRWPVKTNMTRWWSECPRFFLGLQNFERQTLTIQSACDTRTNEKCLIERWTRRTQPRICWHPSLCSLFRC